MSNLDRGALRILRAGLLVLVAGIVWDLVYHASFLLISNPPAWYDVFGNFGHLLTFAGVVVVILQLLRKKGST